MVINGKNKKYNKDPMRQSSITGRLLLEFHGISWINGIYDIEPWICFGPVDVFKT